MSKERQDQGCDAHRTDERGSAADAVGQPAAHQLTDEPSDAEGRQDAADHAGGEVQLLQAIGEKRIGETGGPNQEGAAE